MGESRAVSVFVILVLLLGAFTVYATGPLFAASVTLEVWEDLNLAQDPENAARRARYFDRLFARFTEETGVAVRYTQSRYTHEIMEQLDRGEGPDVILAGEEIEVLGVRGLLHPLNAHLDGWDGLRQIFPRLLQADADTGAVYGVPYTVHIFQGTAYSPPVFARAGFDPDRAPDTWDEMREAALRMTLWGADEPTQLGFDTAWDIPLVPFAYFITQAGGAFTSRDFHTFTFHEEPGKAALEFAASLYQLSRSGADHARSSWGSYRNPAIAFAEERVGIWLLPFPYPLGLAFLDRQRPDWSEAVRFFVSRRDAHTEPALSGFRELAVIPVTARDVDASWHLVRWMLEPENVGETAFFGLSLPTRIDVYQRLFDEEFPALSTWYDALWRVEPSGAVPPFAMNLPMPAWEADVARAFAGEADAGSVLTHWQAVFQAELDRAWARLEHD